MGSEHLLRKLTVTWRDDRIVIEIVEVPAVLDNNDYPKWTQVVALGVFDQVASLVREQLDASVVLKILPRG
jgi:hypothetical protein